VLKEEEAVGWAEWAKMAEQADGAAGPTWVGNRRKIPFRIKIRFLNLPWLWKFLQGDLGGILTQGFS
jgi:hypothetical protein